MAERLAGFFLLLVSGCGFAWVLGHLRQAVVSHWVYEATTDTYLWKWAAPVCLPHRGGDHLGGCAGDCPVVVCGWLLLVVQQGVGVNSFSADTVVAQIALVELLLGYCAVVFSGYFAVGIG